MRNKFRTVALALAACAAGSMMFLLSDTVSAEETGKDALAAELRSQGFPCKTAKSATRDERLSAPNEAVWVLTCDDAIYQMRVVPDMAAKIERLKH